jgi:hypothetical protein
LSCLIFLFSLFLPLLPLPSSQVIVEHDWIVGLSMRAGPLDASIRQAELLYWKDDVNDFDREGDDDGANDGAHEGVHEMAHEEAEGAEGAEGAGQQAGGQNAGAAGQEVRGQAGAEEGAARGGAKKAKKRCDCIYKCNCIKVAAASETARRDAAAAQAAADPLLASGAAVEATGAATGAATGGATGGAKEWETKADKSLEEEEAGEAGEAREAGEAKGAVAAGGRDALEQKTEGNGDGVDGGDGDGDGDTTTPPSSSSCVLCGKEAGVDGASYFEIGSIIERCHRRMFHGVCYRCAWDEDMPYIDDVRLLLWRVRVVAWECVSIVVQCALLLFIGQLYRYVWAYDVGKGGGEGGSLGVGGVGGAPDASLLSLDRSGDSRNSGASFFRGIFGRRTYSKEDIDAFFPSAGIYNNQSSNVTGNVTGVSGVTANTSNTRNITSDEYWRNISYSDQLNDMIEEQGVMGFLGGMTSYYVGRVGWYFGIIRFVLYHFYLAEVDVRIGLYETYMDIAPYADSGLDIIRGVRLHRLISLTCCCCRCCCSSSMLIHTYHVVPKD